MADLGKDGQPQTWDLRDGPTTSLVPVDKKGFRQSNADSAIVIDNGSYNVRAGWAFDRNPRLTFPPIMSRYRDRKQGRIVALVGSDVYLDGTSRSQTRAVFDPGNNVVYNWDVMESVLDYVFIKLGIEPDGDGGIGRPVVMTEPPANPAYPRKTMSEILFECYQAPSIAYGIDSLFAYRQNGGKTGVVVSSSYSATHVIPVIDSQPVMSQAARLNWGRTQSMDYLTKLLRLKYPSFPGKLTDSHVDHLIRDHCYVSSDYQAELAGYLDWSTLAERDRVIQHPYVEPVIVQKSQEEIEATIAKRKESGRRLQEQAAKQRLTRLIQKENDLEFYKNVQVQIAATTTKRDIKRLLESNNFETEAALERAVRELDRSIRKSRNKDVGDADEDEEPVSFALLDIADDQLDEDELRQKRQQKLLKANHDARQRAKAEKAREADRLAEAERQDVDRRRTDLAGWANDRRQTRAALLDRIKDRDTARAELGNRKSTTNQIRMKTLTSLAFDAPVKKRRRGGDEDTFGADDADWDVYRSVANGSDDEDDDLESELAKVEADLVSYDPSFSALDRHDAEPDFSRSLLHAFFHGTSDQDASSVRAQNQLHLNVERIRVPEVTFQPAIAGVDQAGLAELVAVVLTDRFAGHARQQDLGRDIFVTGGHSTIPGLDDRLSAELRAALPADAPLVLRRGRDSVVDAWRGAAGWAADPTSRPHFVSRSEYLDQGGDYIKEHGCGNMF